MNTRVGNTEKALLQRVSDKKRQKLSTIPEVSKQNLILFS